MATMVRVQGLNSFLWSITIYLPRLRQRLHNVKTEIEDQVFALVPRFSPDLFPNLSENFTNLNKEPAYACIFQNISLTPGWTIVGEKGASGSQKKKKTKV